MKKKVKHISGKKRGERITYQVVGVRYRDSKNRIVKFTTKKKLRVAPLMRMRVRSKKTGKMIIQIREIKKYSTKLRKRKRPVTKEEFIKRIKKRKPRTEWETIKGEQFFRS